MTLEERNKMISDNIALAKYIAKRFRHLAPLHEFSDVLSICYLALVKASSYYKPESGTFGSYASACMVNALRKEHELLNLKRSIPASSMCSLDANIKDTYSLKIQDAISCSGFEDHAINSVMARDCLSKVNGKRKDVLIRHFYGGELVCEIAKSTGVSRQAVDQMIRTAIAAIRRKQGMKFYERHA